MTRAEAVDKLDKLVQADIDYDVYHIQDAYTLGYMFNAGFIQQPEQKSYACKCKCCGITRYTSYKRLNCEYCGCDSNQFTCRELK